MGECVEAKRRGRSNVGGAAGLKRCDADNVGKATRAEQRRWGGAEWAQVEHG